MSRYYSDGFYDENHLEHHGVLGMKWGVRRYQNPDGSLTEAGVMRLRGAKRKSYLANKQLGMTIPKNELMAKNKSDPDYEPIYEKGKTVTHITPLQFEKLREGQDLYISAEDYDKVTYKTWLTLMLKNKGYGKDTPIKEVELKLDHDLKAPSENKQKQIFDSFYKDRKEQIDKDLDKYYDKSKNKEKVRDITDKELNDSLKKYLKMNK